jgi:hemerythrin superfamily protein
MAVKDQRRTTAQQDDVVDILLAQHQRIGQLFDRLASATGTQKRELFEDLIRLMAVHEVAEEDLVHPLARRKTGSAPQVVDAHLQEEQQIKRSLVELYAFGTEHAEFDARLRQLRDIALAHFTHEERDELPHLRDTLRVLDLQRLGSVILSVEKRAPTRAHPNVSASATVNLLVGPPLTVFDRVRDAVRDVRQRVEEATRTRREANDPGRAAPPS